MGCGDLGRAERRHRLCNDDPGRAPRRDEGFSLLARPTAAFAARRGAEGEGAGDFRNGRATLGVDSGRGPL